MIPREMVVDEARRWLDPPTLFHHQAYLRGVGVDCIGLIGGIALALGVAGAVQWRDTPEYHDYSKQPDPRLLLAGSDLLMDRVPFDYAQLGDILMMRFMKEPQHFGIVSALDPMYMIHALSTVGKVVENRIDSVWRKRILRVYRFRGVI